MPLKAVLFDFNGVILDDEQIHHQIVADLMRQEQFTLSQEDVQHYCVGRTDRACFHDLFALQGQPISEFRLRRLLKVKAKIYRQHLETLDKLPLFPGLMELLTQIQAAQLKLAIVSGALRADIRAVLKRLSLDSIFPVVVAAEDVKASKPDPSGYQLAMKRLNRQHPGLNLSASDCLAIEDSFAGIQAAKQAQISVVGVAHTFPFHMIQRQANWAIDYLDQLELDRIQAVFNR
ncbi:MAG: HAD family phosphatase [Acaryochloridaceae cyanobacterium SU_2_1]|nr:HAD family phosphatase [Acaryochloridaceae cyanobacterium SU_2_1]NJM95319.1 HAD family phosphatase [Acaryochloridaceae cyanobacterium CSU_5_19]